MGRPDFCILNNIPYLFAPLKTAIFAFNFSPQNTIWNSTIIANLTAVGNHSTAPLIYRGGVTCKSESLYYSGGDYVDVSLNNKNEPTLIS